MKKSYLFAATVLALASCSIDEYSPDTGESRNGEILFAMKSNHNTRAKAGKEAADLLGGNFIVEGLKGAETTTGQADKVVFDNYLVVWGENTAGTTEDNTNDWKYVGVTSSNNMAAAALTGLGRSVSEQSIKYWDYSTENYAFAAYSGGTLKMVSTEDPVGGTSVKVTKIDKDNLGSAAYAFTAKNAADFGKCYITDVIPVAKADYGKPVVLTFKNLGAKVRVGLYETIPGYSVKDVQFYASDANLKYVSVATPNHADLITTDCYDDSGNSQLHTAFNSSATYYSDAAHTTTITDMSTYHGDVITEQYYQQDGTVIAQYTAYNSGTTYYEPAPADVTTTATFFRSSGTFPEEGTITVSYPLLGTSNASKNGYNKADVTVAPETGSTTTTKTFGALTANYTGKESAEEASNIYLGRTLAGATMAGDAANKHFTAVIPVSTGAALTLRCNYTLVSTDGSGEEIKVWGAKAVVSANYCEWQPNYAYTYIFKISDNTNGSTEKLGGTPEGLFPITFDAVVADITDASDEQTTVTTVATPSVTTYQYGHKQGEEYKAGDIYVQVMNTADATPMNIATNTVLYTTTNNKATEADVIDALQMGTVASGVVTGRNGLILTPEATAIDLGAHNIPAVDGTTVAVAAGLSGKFTAVASKNYVFVHDYTTGTPAASVIYAYDAAASDVGATEPTDWTGNYFTKTVVDGVITYTPATTFTASTATAPQYYYKKYENNNHTYAVKVIKTGTAY